MPWFLLPDGRVVGGGVQTIPIHWASKKYPAGVWACWRTLTGTTPGGEEMGKTLLSEVKVLDLEPGLPSPGGLVSLICAECGSDRYAHEVGDYLCVFCRYQNG